MTSSTRNWSQYNKALVRRGNITLWIDPVVLKQWHNTTSTGRPGRPIQYPDALIESVLTIRALFQLPLRMATGFYKSLLTLLKLNMKLPNYTTLSRRQKRLTDIDLKALTRHPLHLLIDSTGLKVYGEGEWKMRTHGKSKRRTWRKLHLGVDATTGLIQASVITDSHIQDCQGVQAVLDHIQTPIECCVGDGAYDRFSIYQRLMELGVKRIVIPPQHNAALSTEVRGHKRKTSASVLNLRDKAVASVRALGRQEWKKERQYHQRSLVETTMFRIKNFTRGYLRSRSIDNQYVEVLIWAKILNRMITI